jgi:hypothetical protein
MSGELPGARAKFCALQRLLLTVIHSLTAHDNPARRRVLSGQWTENFHAFSLVQSLVQLLVQKKMVFSKNCY